MWNNYTVEMQNPGRIEDHLAEARANALEAEARAADPRSTWLAVVAHRAAAATSARLGAARLAVADRARLARHLLAVAARRVAVAAGHLRHPHVHRPAFGHHRR